MGGSASVGKKTEEKSTGNSGQTNDEEVKPNVPVFVHPTPNALNEDNPGDKTPRTDENNSNMIYLPRGGILVQTPIGSIQFGIPPETIKDSMSLGIEIPWYFVILGEMFDRSLGVNIAEFEFPAYFNFFCVRRRVVLVTESDVEAAVRLVFQEALLGPKPEDLNLVEDFPPGTPSSAHPNFIEEGFMLDPDRKNMTVDTLLAFTHFDSKNTAKLDGEVTIKHKRERGLYELRMERKVIATVPARMSKPTRFSSRRLVWEPFRVPVFGITALGCSHGFDPSGTTTGFVLWINGRGVMIDPPPEGSDALEQMGIPARLVSAVVLTHCHADHDAGLFQKLLREGFVDFYATTTIMNSFVRKYSAITGFEPSFVQSLFNFCPLRIGEAAPLFGGQLTAFYSLHTIPTIGFTATFQEHSIAYSGDTHADPALPRQLSRKGLIGTERRKALLQTILTGDHSVVLHEAGVPPIHTPMSYLETLNVAFKERLFLVHVSPPMVPPNKGLKVLSEWDTVHVNVSPDAEGMARQSLVQVLRSNEMIATLLGEGEGREGEGSTGSSPVPESIFTAGEFKQYAKDDVVLASGTAPTHVEVVIAGVASESDGQQNQFRHAVGDIFGERCLSPSTATTNTTVLAATKLHTYRIPCEALLQLPQVAAVQATVQRIMECRLLAAWWLCDRNLVLRRLRTSQKLDLLSGLTFTTIPPGGKLHEFLDASPVAAYVVTRGSIDYICDTSMSKGGGVQLLTFRGKNKAKTLIAETLPPGCMIAAVNALMNDGGEQPIRVANASKEEEAEVAVIQKADFVAFARKNAGFLLNVLDSNIITSDAIM